MIWAKIYALAVAIHYRWYFTDTFVKRRRAHPFDGQEVKDARVYPDDTKKEV